MAGSKPPRERDVLLDALCQHAEATNPLTAQPSIWPKCAKALKDIKAACPNVTPEEIARRCRNYRIQWPTAWLTCTALASHWGRMETPNPAENSMPATIPKDLRLE